MSNNVFAVGCLSTGDTLNFAPRKFTNYEEAEEMAKEKTLRLRIPHFVFAAVSKVVPPEPVCTIVPIRSKELEIG